MIIDVHTHITYGRLPKFSKRLGRQPFPVRTLLSRMDQEGIDISVVLPLTSPESGAAYAIAGNPECVHACGRHPDRLIPFCDIDPRNMGNRPDADLGILMRAFKDVGCKGIGEVTASLSITDPMCKNLFHHAGREKLPVLFHLSDRKKRSYGLIDKIHLPGLESVLKEFPDTIFIGHGPSFWREMAYEVNARDVYPRGAVKQKGRVWSLLAKYPNLYGDLSAGSGHNALHRDPEQGYRFMRDVSKKLLFGTDRFTSKDEPIPPQLPLLKNALADKKITKAVYNDIMCRNFERLLK